MTRSTRATSAPATRSQRSTSRAVGGHADDDGSRYSLTSLVTSCATRTAPAGDGAWFVKIRYKLRIRIPALITPRSPAPVSEVASFNQAPRDARFATAVAGFAELLRGGRYTGSLSYDDVLRIASASRGPDEFGYRSEFIQLVKAAESARSLAKLER